MGELKSQFSVQSVSVFGRVIDEAATSGNHAMSWTIGFMTLVAGLVVGLALLFNRLGLKEPLRAQVMLLLTLIVPLAAPRRSRDRFPSGPSEPRA